MKIKIADNKSLSQVQLEFLRMFPYLRIKFFAGPHAPGSASAHDQLLDNHLTIGKCRKINYEGSFYITPGMSVADLEAGFAEKFGLNVQVFRRGKNVWLETTKSDYKSLSHLNELGREASNPTYREPFLPDLS